MSHKYKAHYLMLAALLLTATTAHGEEIKLRNKGDTCAGANVGAIYYDDGDETFYFCRNTTDGWQTMEDLAPSSGGGSTLSSGALNWNDCEHKAVNKHKDTSATTLTCSTGYKLVSHACSGGIGTTPAYDEWDGSDTKDVDPQCYLTGSDSLYVRAVGSRRQNGTTWYYSTVNASIKCCRVTP